MALPGITDEIIAAAQCGDGDAMWAVVEAHDPIIKQIIRQVAPGLPAERSDDLLQEGRAALITHVRRYDSTDATAQLQTYAYPAVRRAVVDAHLRASTGMTINPTAVLRVRKALADYDGNHEAAFLAVQARHGMERTTFTAVVEAYLPSVSFDQPVGANDGKPGGLTIADTIPDPGSDFTGVVERRNLARHLLTAIAPRQSYALAAFYGVGMTKTPDEDVSAHLQAPKHRVRQLREAGINSARTYAARNGIAA